MKAMLVITKTFVLLSALFAFQAMSLPSDVLGTWAYEASGTPPEYSKGEITFKKVDEAYQVMLTIGQMTVNIDKVTVEDQKVDFSLYIEDSQISVTMNIDGDTFTGKASSYDGTFPLKGKRK